MWEMIVSESSSRKLDTFYLCPVISENDRTVRWRLQFVLSLLLLYATTERFCFSCIVRQYYKNILKSYLKRRGSWGSVVVKTLRY